eukprot:2319536-Alexandrium_andersonii.AAC.1
MTYKFSDSVDAFATQLRQWELLITRYDQIRAQPIADDLKIAVLNMNAPKAVKDQIELKCDSFAGYTQMREVVLNYVSRRPIWQLDPNSSQVTPSDGT